MKTTVSCVKLAAIALLIFSMSGAVMAAPETGRGGELFADFAVSGLEADPNSNCFIAHGEPGCDDAECEATVCAMDSFCCDTAWDQICADEALQFCEITDSEGVARFIVDKLWVDTDLEANDIDDEVVVEIVCNTGLPLTQEATITSTEGVVFVVRELLDLDAVECTISEKTGIADGFLEWSVSNGEVPTDLALGGCVFTGGEGGNFLIQNECILVNQALPAEFTVSTEWNVIGDGGDAVQQHAYIDIYCDEFIQGGSLDPEYAGIYYWFNTVLEGDDSVTVEVNTRTDGTASCHVGAGWGDGAVELVEACEGNYFLPPGGSNSCGFVFNVFFEGIPTLSQYGLAIMALLMLGVGFVGFRRLV